MMSTEKILDPRAQRLIDDYNNHVITHAMFTEKMIELINTITDERDEYIRKVNAHNV